MMKQVHSIALRFCFILALCLPQLPTAASAGWFGGDKITDAVDAIDELKTPIEKLAVKINALSYRTSYCMPPDSPNKGPDLRRNRELQRELDQLNAKVYKQRRQIGTAINDPYFRGREDRALPRIQAVFQILSRAKAALKTKRQELYDKPEHDCSPELPPEDTDGGITTGGGGEEKPPVQAPTEPKLKEPINIPSIPKAPICEKDKESLIDLAFGAEHKANHNALAAAQHIVALNNSGALNSDAPKVLKDARVKWVSLAKKWDNQAIRAKQVRETIQGLATKKCDDTGGGEGGGGGGITTGGGTTGSGGTGSGATGTTGGGEAVAPAAPNCPKCKPIADKLATATAEKQSLMNQENAKRTERNKTSADLKKAQKKVKNLLKQLDPERGTGAESTDTRTGERISSYDNGEGQVEIKRFDAQGNQIGETEYRTRPSTADKRKKLEDAQKEVDRLQKQVDEIDQAIKDLEKKIQDKQKEISQLADAYAQCMKDCKKAIISQPPTTGISVGSGSVSESIFGDDWVEQIERTIGRDLTEDEIKAYADNPEEVSRVLGLDEELTDDKPIPFKPKTPIKPKTPKVSLGDDIEIELEDARTVDGTNALDAKEVENVTHGGGNYKTPDVIVEEIQVIPPTIHDGELITPPKTPIIVTPPVVTTPTTPQIVTTPPPEPKFEFNPFIPLQPLIHIMFSTECPQNGKSMPVSARDGRKVKVEVTSNNQKFITSVKNNNSVNPVIESKFSCEVQGKGNFSEPVTVKMTDPASGKSIMNNYNLSVEVK